MRYYDPSKVSVLYPNAKRLGVPCSHPGGSRTEAGEWECSQCGHLFASYEAWGEETGNQAAVACVKAAIAADLALL